MLEMMNLGSVELPEVEGNVKKFAAGGTGIVVLMKSGNAYGIGDQYFSGTGGNVTTWRLLARNVADIWAASASVLMRTTADRWLFMGFNQYFNTNFGTTITTPRDITTDMPIPEGFEIKQLVLGYRNLAVVFTNGRYAMCGTNNAGGLGTGDTFAVRTLTLRTDFTNVEKIDLDWATYDTSYLLTQAGEVYVSGVSNNGQNGTTSNTTTWFRQSPISGGTVVDIIATTLGFFRVVLLNGNYSVYAQGRSSSGSLGVNNSGNINVLSPPLVFSNVPSRPPLYIGHLSARILHPEEKRVYYTGAATGSLQGAGAQFQSSYSVFTRLAETVPYGGEYSSLKGGYVAHYYVDKGILYGVGNSSAGLLPGYIGMQLFEFTPLELPE